MSDYISNDRNYAILFNRAYGNNSVPSYVRYSGQFNENVRLFENDVGFNVQENLVDQFEGSGRCYQPRKMAGSDSAQSDGNSLSKCIDITYIRELQRLSSSLLWLMSKSGQKGLKVKALDERPQLEQRSKNQGDSGHSRYRFPERQLATQLGSNLATDNPGQGGILLTNVDNVPAGGSSTRTTESYVKALDERPQLEQRSKNQGDSGHSRYRFPERQLASQLGSNLATDNPGQGGILLTNVDNVPAGGSSTRTTESYVKALDERPQLEQRSKNQGDSGHSRYRFPERQLATQLGSNLATDIPGQGGILLTNVDNVPAGGSSTATTVSYKDASSISLFPQTDKTASFTNELSGNVFSAQYSHTPKKDTLTEKERRKKDAHNKIEKRRRSLINDKITELGNLLPEHIDRASCKKKGSILKACVDYIKKLRKDHARINRLEDKMSEAYLEVKKLTLRLEQLETRMTTKVASSGEAGHRKDETSEVTNINKSLTELLSTDKKYPDPALKKHRSDKLTTESEVLGLDEVWDGLSSTMAVDLAVSVPCSVEMDTDDMDGYI